jgi:hypothetical protein
MVIILLILVFDPLAVILLIAANSNFVNRDKKIQQEKRIQELRKLGKRGIVVNKKEILKL